MNFIGTAARAAGLGGGRTNRLGMIASLDHAMCTFPFPPLSLSRDFVPLISPS